MLGHSIQILSFGGWSPAIYSVAWATGIIQTLVFIWLVVSTHLKNISQNGNLPKIGVKIKNIWNHHPVIYLNRLHPKVCQKINQVNPSNFRTKTSRLRIKKITENLSPKTHHFFNKLFFLSFHVWKHWHHPIFFVKKSKARTSKGTFNDAKAFSKAHSKAWRASSISWVQFWRFSVPLLWLSVVQNGLVSTVDGSEILHQLIW